MKNNWEKEFRQNFMVVGSNYMLNSSIKKIGVWQAGKLIKFIKTQIELAEQRGREEAQTK